MSGYPKQLKGLCIGVISGDKVLFQGPPDKENGGHKQKILHLTSITAPKLDPINGNDEKFGFASKEFLRKRLVGQTLSFVVEKKVNEIELGYVLVDGKDILIEHLRQGFAKLRGEKINCDHFDEYKDAQVDAQMGERGVWSEENKPEGAYRFLKKGWEKKQFFEKFKNQKLRGIVEEIHPSKAMIYFPDEGFITTLQFSEVQVVVLSEKLNNGQTKNNAKVIRSVLESTFLSKEVAVNLTAIKEDQLQGFFANKEEDEEVRRILLRNGFAKLGKDAMSGISTKQFMDLKRIAEHALQEGLGLWKEQKTQVVKGQVINSKSYMAIVSEIHSGDSLTVYKEDDKKFVRVYLPNVRAPSNQQPFAYESKQALRKKIIGCKVKVEVEFSKKIPVKVTPEGDKTQLKDFIFASILETNNCNVSSYMLEQGMINLQTPRVEEDVSKHFDDLRRAEEKGKKDRRGIHSHQDPKPPNWNDLSGGRGKKIDAAKCKNLFPFIKEDTKHAVIDLVLNGSRFKMRFTTQNVLAIMVLEGVRCLPNEGQFAKVSEQALQYSKAHASQRDAEVELRSVDQKGIFHGRISINKKDYALELLEKGLAVCMGGKFKNARYEDAESFARKNKFGLWKHNLNLNALRGETEKVFKPVNFQKKMILTEATNASELYLQVDGAAKPNVPQNPQPAANISVGQLYAVKFTVDGQYYRARVLKELAGNKYNVQYIDYGNYENAAKGAIGVLPQNLKGFKTPLYRCSLYGIEGVTGQGLNIIRDYVNAELTVDFVQQSVPQGNQGIEYQVILTEKKDDALNLQLLQFGEAECNCDREQWKNAEDKAKQQREGKWLHDEN